MKNRIVVTALNPAADKTLTVDSLVPYGLNRVKAERLDPGGKGVNVARVLKNFGADVAVSGLIAGENGKFIERCLRESDISCDFLEVEGDTRMNIKIFDEAAGKITEINERGFYVSEEAGERYKRGFGRLMSGSGIAVLSGSLPPGLPEGYYAELISTAKKSGVKTLLDADGGALREGTAALPYAVKPNLYELETLIGRKCESPGDVSAAAMELVRGGIELVLVSMGADGAVLACKNGSFRAKPWNITVRGTVGAGDSMAAALALSIAENLTPAETARFAVAAGTVTASKPGTATCTRDEVLASLSKVCLAEIG